MIDKSDPKLATSTNDVTHVIVGGYYKCNKAIGKINRSQIFRLSENRSINPCQNCFKFINDTDISWV